MAGSVRIVEVKARTDSDDGYRAHRIRLSPAVNTLNDLWMAISEALRLSSSCCMLPVMEVYTHNFSQRQYSFIGTGANALPDFTELQVQVYKASKASVKRAVQGAVEEAMKKQMLPPKQAPPEDRHRPALAAPTLKPPKRPVSTSSPMPIAQRPSADEAALKHSAFLANQHCKGQAESGMGAVSRQLEAATAEIQDLKACLERTEAWLQSTEVQLAALQRFYPTAHEQFLLRIEATLNGIATQYQQESSGIQAGKADPGDGADGIRVCDGEGKKAAAELEGAKARIQSVEVQPTALQKAAQQPVTTL